MVSEILLELLKSRRSIRRFKPEPPPRDLVLKAIDVARYAPSARNSQPWRFIIIEDPVIRQRLGGIHIYAKPVLNAPLAVVVACMNDESPTSYLLDCANATIYFMLAAHALGLGTVWIQTLRNVKEIREILGLPDNVTPVSLLAVGYPAENPGLRPRKPLEEVVYLNKYGEPLKT